MHWKLKALLAHIEIDTTVCDDHVVHTAPPGWIMMVRTSHASGGFTERLIEQVEVHEGQGLLIMKDDYDNPIFESELASYSIMLVLYRSSVVIG